MFSDARAAVMQIFTPPFRKALGRSVTITICVLALAWLTLDYLILSYANVTNAWLAPMLSALTGLGLLVGLVFLVAPVTSLAAGFFLDDLAERVERQIGPPGAVGRALPMGPAMLLAAKFAGVSLLVNLCALMLLLVPLVNVVAFFTANAYLLGREYFELAAIRYRSIEEARALRRKHRLYIFFCGFFIAAFVIVPVVNLLTPLFGVAFMVRIHRRLAPLPQLAQNL